MVFDTNKKPVGNQKLKGSYYTPLELARYLTGWALRDVESQRILEPSAGDGNFVVACLEQVYSRYDKGKVKIDIVAVEIERDAIEKGKERVQSLVSDLNIHNNHVTWLEGDFFDIYETLRTQDKFDIVLGNPPFIRFQYFDSRSRTIAFKHLRDAGYTPTKLSNVWVAFLQLSIELLRDSGRLAMVVPAEILQVKYASELRSRLSKQFDHIVLVGFKKLVFPEIQQEVLLLLAEGKRSTIGPPSDIHTIEFENGNDLLGQENLANAIVHVPSKHSRNGMKWTSLFLSDRSFEILDRAERTPGLIKLGELAEVDIGVVTGRNSFFVVTQELRDKLGISDYTTPIIGRTAALKSIIFRRTDFEKYAQQFPAYLLTLSGIDEQSFPVALREYIASGVQENVHLGFKCRMRRRWFDVPSVYIPDAFMFRQIHKFPLLILNSALVTSTDTIHRVRFKKGVNPNLLAIAFFNSLTFAWAEVCGRSYGGGVLELEPREAEELPIPYDEKLSVDIEKVDHLLRQDRTWEALDYVDGVVLREHLGFDTRTIHEIRAAWNELRDRRINRH